LRKIFKIFLKLFQIKQFEFFIHTRDISHVALAGCFGR
jgi:hypothetical protein